MNAAVVLQDHAASNPSQGGPGGALLAANMQADANVATANANQQVALANVAAGASPGLAVGSGTAIETEAYDAMDVKFEVSAEKPLNHPYVVVIGRYHEKGDPAGALRNWIYAQALERVDSKRAKVEILRGGMRPGFVMKDLQVHLYNDGQEVATNVSSKRVALTRDEAFEYVKMDYVSSHKGTTLPAVPAMGKLPADLPSRLAQGQFTNAFYVKVSKDGVGANAYFDEACSRPVEDPYIAAVLKDIRFKPALEKGKPVDGVAKLKLGQLVM
jgi:hypothetical protein